MNTKVSLPIEPRKRIDELGQIIFDPEMAQTYFDALLFFVVNHRFQHPFHGDHGEKVQLHIESIGVLIEYFQELSKE